MKTAFKDFLFENSDITAEKILQDAHEFITAGNAKLMVHGSKTFADEVARYSFKFRSGPKDTSRKHHDMFNDAFEKHLGVLRVRDWLFCSSPPGRAKSEYGPQFYIFPIGEFEWVWSPKCWDLYDELRMGGEMERVLSILTNDDWNYFMRDENYEMADNILQKVLNNADKFKQLGFTLNSNLRAALYSSSSEIMVKCKEFYVVPVQSEMAQQIKTLLK